MSKPNPVSTAVLIDVVNSVEGLVNLAYLIDQNRHNPDDVLRHIRMVDVTLKRMTSLIIETHMSETLETTSQQDWYPPSYVARAGAGKATGHRGCD